MRLHSRALALTIGATCCVIGGCPPETGEPTPGTDTEISDARRLEILDEVDALIAAIDDDDFGVQNRKIVAQLLALPEITEAETDETGAIWARFTDGRLLGVHNDPDEDPLPPVTDEDLAKLGLTAKPVYAEPIPKADLAAKNIPTARVQIISGLHKSRRSAVPVVTQLFLAGGYELVPDGPKPSIEQWKNLGAAGFYLFEGHGTCFRNSAGQLEFAFLSDIPVNLDNELKLKQDLLDGAVFPVVNSRGHHKYALTRVFFDKYVQFSNESVVWFNSCCGGSTIARAFRDTCFAKGAGIYIGWDHTAKNIDVEASIYYVVIHTLGLNIDVTFTTSQGTIQFTPPPPTPPRRPFSFLTAFGPKAPNKPNQFPFTLTSGGRPYNESIGAACDADIGCTQVQSNLVAFGNSTLDPARTDFILAPSIQRMELDERTKTLTLYGLFDVDGSNRKVIAGGQEFTNAEWGEEQIVIRDFPTAAGGLVYVAHTSSTSSAEIRSNPRWLTKISEVNFTITTYMCTHPQPGEKHCGDDAIESCNRFDKHEFKNLTFRTDLGYGRDAPFDEPIFQGGHQNLMYATPAGASYSYSAGGTDNDSLNLRRSLESNGGIAHYAMPETAFVGIDSGVRENEFTCYFGVTTDASGARHAFFEPSVWIPDNLKFINSYPCADPPIDDQVSGVVDVGCNSCVIGDPSNTTRGNWDLPLNGGAGWGSVSGTVELGFDRIEYSASDPTITDWPDSQAPQ